MTNTTTTDIAIALDNDGIGRVAEAFRVSNERAYDMIRETITEFTTHEHRGPFAAAGIAYRSATLSYHFSVGRTYLAVTDYRS